MWRYVSRRALLMIPTFFGITLVAFAVLHLVPGDPTTAVDTASAGQMSRESAQAFRHAMGLDRPLHERYFGWLGRIARFDFGVSTYDHRPVIEKIGEALPNTLLLAGLALLLTYLIAVPLGVASAVRQDRLLDRALTAVVFVLYSLPSFWVAILLLLAFGGGRHWDLFPMQGLHSPGAEQVGLLRWLADLGWHLVLPVFCLTYASLASVSRYARGGMLEVIRQDYVRAARAKGLGEAAVVFKHALRNAVIPLVTLLGLSLPQLVGGSVIIEQVFGVPGMGRLALQAMVTRDYATVMGVITLTALLTMAGLLLSDLACALIDPRIRCA